MAVLEVLAVDRVSVANDAGGVVRTKEAALPRLAARLALTHPAWPQLAAPDLEVGVDPCPGPGSRHTPYPLAAALVRSPCDALAELGAPPAALTTFHGAPLHNLALQAGGQYAWYGGIEGLRSGIQPLGGLMFGVHLGSGMTLTTSLAASFGNAGDSILTASLGLIVEF